MWSFVIDVAQTFSWKYSPDVVSDLGSSVAQAPSQAPAQTSSQMSTHDLVPDVEPDIALVFGYDVVPDGDVGPIRYLRHRPRHRPRRRPDVGDDVVPDVAPKVIPDVVLDLVPDATFSLTSTQTSPADLVDVDSARHLLTSPQTSSQMPAPEVVRAVLSGAVL